MSLTIEYICDDCERRVKHSHIRKPPVLPRKEFGWLWIHVIDVDGGHQKLLCPDCLEEEWRDHEPVVQRD